MAEVPAPHSFATSAADVAHHEAGHVVVGNLLGLRLLGTDIKSDDDGGRGHTFFAPPAPGTPDADFSRRVVTTFLAGRIAEMTHNRGADPEGFGFDVDQVVREWAVRLGGDARTRRERLAGLEAKAEALVRRPEVWAAIERVAGELLRRQELTGAEAGALVPDDLGRDQA